MEHIEKRKYHNKACKLLIVDDDYAVLRMLSEVLREQGFSIASAARADQAIGLVHTFKPHTVVIGTDGRGTFEPGWHLAMLLRQQLPGLPMIMLSTSDMAVAEVGVTLRGRLFHTALLKPFRLEELVAAIQDHIPYSASLSGV